MQRATPTRFVQTLRVGRVAGGHVGTRGVEGVSLPP